MLESESEASYDGEGHVSQLRMADLGASGQVGHALFDAAAEAIVADAAAWRADLIVLGYPRRGGVRTRLFRSGTPRVVPHAPCPGLVASPAGQGRLAPGGVQPCAGRRSC